MNEEYTEEGRRSDLARRSWALAAIVAIVGAGASLAAWRHQARLAGQALDAEFRQEAELLHRAVEREVSLFAEVLGSLRALHNLSAQIRDEDFAEFVAKGMQHQQRVLGAFGFVQRVPHEYRESIERAEGDRPGMSLVEPDEQGGLRPAAERPEYYPLTYQSPEEGLGLPIGYDLAATPAGRGAVARLQTVESATTGGSVGDGLLVFSPIYYPGAGELMFPPPGYLAGFAAAVWRPARTIEQALAARAPDRLRAEVREGAAGDVVWTLNRPFHYEAPLRVADRNWLFICDPGPAFELARRDDRSWFVLAAGLGLTALIAGQLAAVAHRTRRVEALVRRRTADLQDAHRQLQNELGERMRLEREIHDVAAREQQRVGRDLHDSLGQKLTGAMMVSRGLARSLEGSEGESPARQLNEILKDSVAEVRRMARGLAPVALGEDGLADALRRLAEDTRQTYGVHFELNVSDGTCSLDAEVAEQVYYIAREAVHNAARHAGPRRIRLALDREADGWRLAVEDDGAGLPADAEQRGGMGLRILRHRAKSIGAKLDLSGGPEGGTTMACAWKEKGGRDD